MSRRSLSLLPIIAMLSLAACTGGTTTTAAPSGAPAASEPGTASASAGTGAAVCAPSEEAGAVEAAMVGIAFVPTAIAAKVGDVITWTNDDTVQHTASLTEDPTCTTPRLDPGTSGGLTFSAPGTYAFFCMVHANMTGTIEVTS